MDTILALKAFAGLSQDKRLEAFRILVRYGDQGIAAGDLSKKLGIPQNTLSFHLSHLSQAELVRSRKEGRSIIYFANLNTVQEMVRFLLEDCCAMDKSTCRGVEKLLRKTCC
jgi:ArsR family transcriptional regulator, arsenate/arsenite/antimonite-responsive transcriptional repressor